RTDRPDQEAGHAWAEAHVEGLGWVGFDPTHGVCITDRHVRVATGADYLEAAPVRGAHVGGGDELLSVAIRVKQGRSIAQC
ncbi:MAG: transglutaminase family protein, partial [bacterium]